MRELKPIVMGAVLRAKNMSAAELARRASMDRGTVSWILTGRYVPYESQLDKLAAALEWEGDKYELLEEVE